MDEVELDKEIIGEKAYPGVRELVPPSLAEISGSAIAAQYGKPLLAINPHFTKHREAA